MSMFRHIYASGGNAFCTAWLVLCVSVSYGCHRRPLEDPEYLKACPHRAQIGRPDEVNAARHPVLRYRPEEEKA